MRRHIRPRCADTSHGWEEEDSNLRRLSRRFYRSYHLVPSRPTLPHTSPCTAGQRGPPFSHLLTKAGLMP